jgi:hypothetical protein
MVPGVCRITIAKDYNTFCNFLVKFYCLVLMPKPREKRITFKASSEGGCACEAVMRRHRKRGRVPGGNAGCTAQ